MKKGVGMKKKRKWMDGFKLTKTREIEPDNSKNVQRATTHRKDISPQRRRHLREMTDERGM